jgi:phage baseplate assembly protein W
MAKGSKRDFKDISLSFKPHPVTGDVMALKNEKAIQRSVRNLVQTGLTERFYSNLGTDIYGSLFGYVDYATGGVIAQQVLDVLRVAESRIDKVTVNVDPRPDDNEFEVRVSYTISGESPVAQNYSFIVEATR